MALDGIVIANIVDELKMKLLNGRVNMFGEPEKF